MKFYEAIAKYYDYIFPTGQSQVEFLEKTLGNSPKKVLDIACGTGNYSIALAQKGHDVTSIDLDSEMIQRLRTKANAISLPINAMVEDMMKIDSIGNDFDLVFCIGNSLVHLQSIKDIDSFIQSARKTLTDNGKLIIQIINYDRIIKQDIKSLPTIKNNETPLVFDRLYNYDKLNNKVMFKTILKVEGKEIQNEIPLYPLLSSELLDALNNNGFSNIKCYGDFNKTIYDPDTSFMLVVEAK